MMFNKAPHSNLDCQAVVWASLGYLKGISRWKTAGSKSLQNTLCIRMQPHSPTNLWRPTFCVTRCFLATAPCCACPGLKSSLCRSGHKVPVAGCCGSNQSWIHGNSVGHLECSPHPIRMRKACLSMFPLIEGTSQPHIHRGCAPCTQPGRFPCGRAACQASTSSSPPTMETVRVGSKLTARSDVGSRMCCPLNPMRRPRDFAGALSCHSYGIKIPSEGDLGSVQKKRKICKLTTALDWHLFQRNPKAQRMGF